MSNFLTTANSRIRNGCDTFTSSLKKVRLKIVIKFIFFIAIILVFLGGGGIETKGGTRIYMEGLPGLIKSLNEYFNQKHDREMQSELMEKAKREIKIKDISEFKEILKQISPNKDLPK